jgi:hypothetical protein
MAGHRYRLIDTAGSELGIVSLDEPEIHEDDTVQSPEGAAMTVVEVYDDEFGKDGGVVATLVVDDG